MGRLDGQVAKLAAEQHNLFTREQLLKLGFTDQGIRSRLECGAWERVSPGLYRIAGSADPAQRAMAVILRLPGSFASHRTACALIGLIEELPERVEVSVQNGAHYRARRGYVIHQAGAIARGDIRIRDWIPMTTPLRTVIDTSAVMRGRPYEIVLDRSLVRGHTSIDALRRYVDRRALHRHHGVPRLLKHLDDREFGIPESELERDFRDLVRRAGLPEPIRQKRVGGRKLDVCYPDCNLVIELDSRAHHSTATDLRADARRHNELFLAGSAPSLRFSWYDVRLDEAYVVAAVRAGLRQAQDGTMPSAAYISS